MVPAHESPFLPFFLSTFVVSPESHLSAERKHQTRTKDPSCTDRHTRALQAHANTQQVLQLPLCPWHFGSVLYWKILQEKFSTGKIKSLSSLWEIQHSGFMSLIVKLLLRARFGTSLILMNFPNRTVRDEEVNASCHVSSFCCILLYQ